MAEDGVQAEGKGLRSSRHGDCSRGDGSSGACRCGFRPPGGLPTSTELQFPATKRIPFGSSAVGRCCTCQTRVLRCEKLKTRVNSFAFGVALWCFSACILTVLRPLLAALGRRGACVCRSWSLLGLSWRSLGPSRPLCGSCAILQAISTGSSHLAFKLAAMPVHFSCRGCTHRVPPGAHHQTLAKFSAEDHFRSRFHNSPDQLCRPKAQPLLWYPDGELDCVSVWCLLNLCECQCYQVPFC